MASITSVQAGLKIELLGPLVVTRDGRRQELPRSRKTRALLAYLALTRRVHRRDDLAALLWDGTSDPRGELRWSLARIKSVVGPVLEVCADGIGLTRADVFVDAHEFRNFQVRPATRQNLDEALGLWRGVPLADAQIESQPVFQAWLEAEREALGALRGVLLKAAIELASEHPESALSAARRLVACEPWNEWGHAKVAQLLERCGRGSEAADYAASVRRRLSRELGIPESEVLKTFAAMPSRASRLRATALAGALEPEANRQALHLLKGLVEEEPDDPAVLALMAWCHAQRAVYNWSSSPERDRQEARHCAAAATRDDLQDASVLTTLAAARTLVFERHAAGELLDRALRLNGDLPSARTRSGWLANSADEPELAVRHFKAAIDLAPLDPGAFNAYAGLGAAHFIQGDHVRAIRRMEQALALNPKALWIYRNLVPAYVAAGDRRSAQEGVEALAKGYPRLTVSDITGTIVFSAPVLAKIASGLRASGVPA